MSKSRKSPDTVKCANCGNAVPDSDAVYGQRFLSVENEWRPQTLCRPCAEKLPADQYRWSE